MNNNIFNPKGSITTPWFLSYYVLLILIRTYGLAYLFLSVMIKGYSMYVYVLLLCIIQILLIFNYKKRLMLSLNNWKTSSLWAILLTFDIDLLAFLSMCIQQNNEQVSIIFFYISMAFYFLVQPIIVSCLPKSKSL